MNEERMHILKMLQEGKITVDEAAKLLEAIGNPQAKRATVVPVINPGINEAQPITPLAQREPALSRFHWSLLTFLFSNLEGANMDDGLYEGTRIFCSNLDGANLRTGNFQDTWVLCANLDSANFEGANLQGAKIFASNLDHADFRGADLRDTLIICANFDHADFRGVDLHGKTFIGVSFAGYKADQATTSITLEA